MREPAGARTLLRLTDVAAALVLGALVVPFWRGLEVSERSEATG